MEEMLDSTELRKHLAANISRLRAAAGWSQTKLAEQIGISQVFMSRVENGHASPSAEVLYAIADALGVSADALRQTADTKNLRRPA
jgi:transcriptional regulator with XRE-family HTH domain